MQPERHADTPSSFWPRLILAAQVLLIVCLLAVVVSPTSPAASASPSGTGRDVLVEVWDEEGEEEWETEELEEESDEEGNDEGGREEGTAGPIVLPRECVLHTALPSVVAAPDKSRLRLAIRYTAEAGATKVGVNYWLKGGKGSHQLGSAVYPLHSQGTLRMSHHLDSQDTAKVRAARIFVVQLKLPHVADYCKRYLTFRLARKHLRGDSTTWSE